MSGDPSEEAEVLRAMKVLAARGLSAFPTKELDALLAVAGASVSRDFLREELERQKGELVAEVVALVAGSRGSGKVVPEPVAGPTPAPEARVMTIKGYAARSGISERTVHKLLGQGLPSRGAGRLRRIVVFAADEWMRKHAGKKAAHG